MRRCPIWGPDASEGGAAHPRPAGEELGTQSRTDATGVAILCVPVPMGRRLQAPTILPPLSRSVTTPEVAHNDAPNLGTVSCRVRTTGYGADKTTLNDYRMSNAEYPQRKLSTSDQRRPNSQ